MTIKKVIWANRKTFSLRIDDNGDIIVVAPEKASLKDIAYIIQKKRRWIDKTRRLIEETKDFIRDRKFIDGEMFFYLGKKYLLKFYDGDIIQINDKGLFLLPNYPFEKIKNKVIEWYLVEAKSIFREYLEKHSKSMNVQYSSFKLSNSKTRWGSCNKNGGIRLNWRLIMMPPSVIEYIVIHELAHIVYPNHSKAFYNFVGNFCPGFKEQIKLLKEYNFIAKLFR